MNVTLIISKPKSSGSSLKYELVNEDTGSKITGAPAKIANHLLENLNSVVTFKNMNTLIDKKELDYFNQRIIDVHLNSVKKFLKPKYEISRITKVGIVLSKVEQTKS